MPRWCERQVGKLYRVHRARPSIHQQYPVYAKGEQVFQELAPRRAVTQIGDQRPGFDFCDPTLAMPFDEVVRPQIDFEPLFAVANRPRAPHLTLAKPVAVAHQQRRAALLRAQRVRCSPLATKTLPET